MDEGWGVLMGRESIPSTLTLRIHGTGFIRDMDTQTIVAVNASSLSNPAACLSCMQQLHKEALR